MIQKSLILPKEWEPYIMDQNDSMPEDDIHAAVSSITSSIIPESNKDYFLYEVESAEYSDVMNQYFFYYKEF